MKLRVGTRCSALALAQTRAFCDFFQKRYKQKIDFSIVPIKTTGDKLYHHSLNKIGGKGLFIKEIDDAIVTGDVDIGVHSLKDVPATIHPDLTIACLLPRNDPRDVLIVSPKYRKSITDFSTIPNTFLIGTCSSRRKNIILNRQPDLRVIDLRGNIDTRIEKVMTGHCDAIILAAAGLKRIDLLYHAEYFFPVHEFVPAIGQGTISVICSRQNTKLLALLKNISDEETEIRSAAERSFLNAMSGDCTTPMGAHAEVIFTHDRKQKLLKLNAIFFLNSPANCYNKSGNSEFTIASATELGIEVANKIKDTANLFCYICFHLIIFYLYQYWSLTSTI